MKHLPAQLPLLLVALLLALSACSNGTETTASSLAPETAPTTGATTTTSSPPTTTIAPTGDGSALDAPLPVGVVGSVGDWMVRVATVNPDAYDALTEIDEFIWAPDDGFVHVLIELQATLVTGGPVAFAYSVEVGAIGKKGAYNEFDDGCGFFAYGYEEAFPGGTITKSVCLTVPIDDASELTLSLDDWSTDDQLFLSADPDTAIVEADTSEDVTVIRPQTDLVLSDNFAVGDWIAEVSTVTVGDVHLAADLGLELGTELEDDDVVVHVRVDSTYQGESPIGLDDLSVTAFGTTNVALSTSGSKSCLSNQLIRYSALAFTGATVTHEACWITSSADAAELLIRVASWDSFDEGVIIAASPGTDETPTDQGDAPMSPATTLVPAGSLGDVGVWSVRILEANLGTEDPNAFVALESDQAILRLDLEVTNTSDSDADLFEFVPRLLLDELTTTSSGGNDCASYEETLSARFDPVAAGETITGAACWVIDMNERPIMVGADGFYDTKFTWFELPPY